MPFSHDSWPSNTEVSRLALFQRPQKAGSPSHENGSKRYGGTSLRIMGTLETRRRIAL